MTMKRIIILFAVLVALVSCASSTIKGKTQLTVTFHDYIKDAIRVYLSDKSGNGFEEMHDAVFMKVESGDGYIGNDYQIEITEVPVRNQFTSTAKLRIQVNSEIIKNYGSNKIIFSTEIEFIK